jgi:hypothetical protein
LRICIGLLWVSVLLVASAVPQSNNRYLRPSEFPNVPRRVRQRLESLHCLIPQDVETPVPHNIVIGEFARKGQQDWAAYCSRNATSKVLIIWGGSSTCSGEPFGLQSFPDDSIYRNADPQQWGRMPPPGIFWKLSAVRPEEVLARHLVKSIPHHDALERSSIMGANGVYCMNGKWREVWYGD